MKKIASTILILILTFFLKPTFAQLPNEWPYELGKPLDSRFYDQIKNMELKETASDKYGISTFKLFVNNKNNASDDGSDEVPSWEHDALIQINNYYYEFHLGAKLENDKYYNLLINDIAGVEKRNEIIIETGCFTDGGCANRTYVFFNHKSGPLSMIRLSMMQSYSKSSNGELIITDSMNGYYNGYNCYKISQSYKLSKYSIIKTKTLFKKRKVECVG